MPQLAPLHCSMYVDNYTKKEKQNKTQCCSLRMGENAGWSQEEPNPGPNGYTASLVWLKVWCDKGSFTNTFRKDERQLCWTSQKYLCKAKGQCGREWNTSWFGNEFSNTWKVQLDFLLLGKRWYITRDPFQELWKYKVT